MRSKKVFQLLAMAVALVFIGAAGAMAQDEESCEPEVWNLYAGQDNIVGTVTVSNDSDNLYIQYKIDTDEFEGATFGVLHAWVGFDLKDLPSTSNPQGTTPVPGQFPYQSGKAPFPSSEGETEYTFTIPFSSINITIPEVNCEDLRKLFVVTHAEVNGVVYEEGQQAQNETAFGGCISVNVDQPGRWWWYCEYQICCDFDEPPQLCFSETAFAKGTHVFVTEKKSNPESLPSLGLTRNQWGWAIKLTEKGITEYDIWAGAGLNRIYPDNPKAVKVGQLRVFYRLNPQNEKMVNVRFYMEEGFFAEEIHLYISKEMPTTTAPGQFGYPSEGYDVNGVHYFEYDVNLGTNGSSVWIIAHSVVSNGQCD